MESLSILVIEDNKDFRAMVREEIRACRNFNVTLFMPESIKEAQTLVALPEEFSYAFFDWSLDEWTKDVTGDELAKKYLEVSHAPKDHVFDISSQLHHFDELELKHLGKPGLIYFVRSSFCSAPNTVCNAECPEKFGLRGMN